MKSIFIITIIETINIMLSCSVYLSNDSEHLYSR